MKKFFKSFGLIIFWVLFLTMVLTIQYLTHDRQFAAHLAYSIMVSAVFLPLFITEAVRQYTKHD